MSVCVCVRETQCVCVCVSICTWYVGGGNVRRNMRTMGMTFASLTQACMNFILFRDPILLGFSLFPQGHGQARGVCAMPC